MFNKVYRYLITYRIKTDYGTEHYCDFHTTKCKLDSIKAIKELQLYLCDKHNVDVVFIENIIKLK